MRMVVWVKHLAVTGGRLETGVGPAPGEAGLVIGFRTGDLTACRAPMRAAAGGRVTLKGRSELLDTFLRVFAPPRPA